MAETTYKDLKLRIEELIENIDKIDQEAASFSTAKAELEKSAKDLQSITNNLSSVLKTSDAILTQVETVAVSSTLESFKSSADRFSNECDHLFKELNKTSIEQIESLQQKIDVIAYDLKKTVLLMCGVAIICSVVALIVAFV